MRKILIFGSSGHARSIAEILENLNYEIVGFIDSFRRRGEKILNYKTLGNEDVLYNCKKKYGTNLVVVGIGDIQGRAKVVDKIREINSNIVFPTIISPSASVSKYVNIGEGTVVFSNSLVNTECEIGNFCVINSGGIIEHNVQVKDFCTLSPLVNIGGDVKIEEHTFIGSSSTVIQKVKIGKHSVIGAGAVVIKNVPDNVLALGIPAAIKKENYKNDKLFQ